MDTVISVKDLVNRFGKQVVHDGLCLDIRRDEILGVVGGSGSGKSVLMRSIRITETYQWHHYRIGAADQVSQAGTEPVLGCPVPGRGTVVGLNCSAKCRIADCTVFRHAGGNPS